MRVAERERERGGGGGERERERGGVGWERETDRVKFPCIRTMGFVL